MRPFVYAVLLAVTFAGCGQGSIFTLDKSDAFARIETDISTPASRARVIELMGTPAEQSYHDLLGVSHERLTFKDGKRAYTVTLIAGMAVSKSVEPISLKGERP